jgi:formylmethanofuran dehydrogenase subunit E
MEDFLSASDETVCSKCGHPLSSPEQSLSMDGDQTLCTQCYRSLLVPGYKAAQMENLD